MVARRRLADLYLIGKEVTFDDGDGDPLTVFVRKLNPVDHESALRSANAARSRAMSVTSRPDSDEYQEMYLEVAEMGRDVLISYLVEDMRVAKTPVIEAELAAGDEWTKDNYLEGLLDAWNDGLAETYARNPEDVEADRVFAEMGRFSEQVGTELGGAVEQLMKDIEHRSDDALRQDVLEKMLSIRSSIAWLNEYRRCEIWLSVRESDKKTRYFNQRNEVDDLSIEVYARLLAVYREISVDPQEGKGLREEEASSPSSATPANPETDAASGQPSAAA